MRFILYSPVHFERWDWRNSVETGIGGSETSHVELAWRLARRGHEVISYAPVPWDSGVREWRGTQWAPLAAVDWTLLGVWILYRCPDALDNFPQSHADQLLWLLMQDERYNSWTETRVACVDRVLALCRTHAKVSADCYPLLREKLCVTSNGVKMELVRATDAANVTRNPHKLVYASSPDRGLKGLLHIFRRAREFVDDLELHIFYGFDNCDKLAALEPRFGYYRQLKEEIVALADQPGVSLRGRIDQPTLYREWASAGLFVYPTNFSETSCTSVMEAQALGAIPITNPTWALAENVLHGMFIEGDAYNDPLTQARYAAEIVRWTTQGDLQERLRPQMMRDARARFNWERAIDRIEAWTLGFDPDCYQSQFAFQLRHAQGRVLNVGCGEDPGQLRERCAAVNVDIVQHNPINGRPHRIDVLGDARALPTTLHGRFDSVIVGDVLEHLSPDDGLIALQQARLALTNGGRLIVTCPEDSRPVSVQHSGARGTECYADGISCFHERPITRKELAGMLAAAQWEATIWQRLDYTDFEGWGVVAR